MIYWTRDWYYQTFLSVGSRRRDMYSICSYFCPPYFVAVLLSCCLAFLLFFVLSSFVECWSQKSVSYCWMPRLVMTLLLLRYYLGALKIRRKRRWHFPVKITILVNELARNCKLFRFEKSSTAWSSNITPLAGLSSSAAWCYLFFH